MKRLIFAAILAICSLLGNSAINATRIVDYPWINFASGSTLDISQVELTDTATVLHIKAHFRPKNWITIAGTSTLKADGKSYALKGAEGITPDEKFWMPDTGTADFTLIFEPMPESTQIFDFSEGDIDGAFRLEGIDLTGNPQPQYPAGVPAEVMTAFIDGPVPAPAFEIGETTINFHLLPYTQGMMTEMNVYVNGMDGSQEEYPVKFDNNGNATIKFKQYGSGKAFAVDMNSSQSIGGLTLYPGETVDCWIDTRINGGQAMRYREGFDADIYRSKIHNGKYSNYDRMTDNRSSQYYGYRLNDFDYHMSGNEYKDKLKSIYFSSLDSIQNETMPQMKKEYKTLALQDNILFATAHYTDILRNNYMSKNNDWSTRPPMDSIPALLSDKDYVEIASWFDIENPKLLMIGNNISKIDWNSHGVKCDLPKALHMYRKMSQKVKSQTLQSSDLDSLKTLSDPFFATACNDMYEINARKLEELKNMVTVSPTPEVEADAVFDAIIAPHKGKVVIVDLWNTWCGPCRMALKQTEPLKEGELNDKDIVWIYIADESSDPVKYLEMLPGIKGIHYKVNEEQKNAIRKRFEVDGIPYYILVDREGNAEGRPDLRDHYKYVKAIKSKL